MIRAEFPRSGYAAYHAPRWAFTLKEVHRLLAAVHGRRPRVLDIGRSGFTALLERHIPADVDSLGFELHGSPLAGCAHLHFDLNDSQYPERWLTGVAPYDVIVFGEVIEHLHTAPPLVLAFVRTLMRPDGAMVLQTPNAVQLASRLRMLAGRNPYHLINIDPTAPAHFREYTESELRAMCAEAGLMVEGCAHHALFDSRYRVRAGGGHRPDPDQLGGQVRNLVYRWLPPNLRPGLSFVLRPTATADAIT